MNGMQRLAVISMLALGLLVAGAAQSQGRWLKLDPAKAVKKGLFGLGDSAAVVSLKKGVIYVILPFMLCLGSCDNAEHAPQQNTPAKVEKAIEKQPAMIAANGSWLVKDSDSQRGVYTHRPAGARSDGYQLVKLYDETGKLLPATLRKGWQILYKSKDGGWDGSGWYDYASIKDISDEGVLIDDPYVSIDISQVIGVEIIETDLQENREVMFSPSHILPYLYGAMTDLRIEINTTEDIYFLGSIEDRFTSGHVEVRVRGDHYYIRQAEHVFTEREGGIPEIHHNYFLLEQGNLIMKKDITIVGE